MAMPPCIAPEAVFQRHLTARISLTMSRSFLFLCTLRLLMFVCAGIATSCANIIPPPKQEATPTTPIPEDTGAIAPPSANNQSAPDNKPSPQIATAAPVLLLTCVPLPAGCLCPEACSSGTCDNNRCKQQPTAQIPQSQGAAAITCGPEDGRVGGQTYKISIVTEPKPADIPDKTTNRTYNPLVLPLRSSSEPAQLVDYNGGTDVNAPKFKDFFADRRIPQFISAEAFVSAEGNAWPVEVLGMTTAVSEIIHTPSSGYGIGEDLACMVIYADAVTLTCKYTREDHIISGYTLHVMDVCLDPDLLSAYNSVRDTPDKRPGLFPKQPFGRAMAGRLRVAIRDTGTLMDPRSRKDWWQ